MEIATVEFDTEVETFQDASGLIMALLHAPNKTQSTYHITNFDHGSPVVDAVIDMIDRIESPSGLDDMAILTHSKVYYRIRKDCRSVLEMSKHDPQTGYAGTFLGHNFFAHPRIRPNTVVVGGKKNESIRFVVGSEGEWDVDQFLMV